MSSRHVDHIRMAPHGYQPAMPAGADADEEFSDDATPPRSPIMPAKRTQDHGGKKSPIIQARRIPDIAVRRSPLMQHRRSPALPPRDYMHSKPPAEAPKKAAPQQHELEAMHQPAAEPSPLVEPPQPMANGHHPIYMTGTIKRGHKRGADVEVQLELTAEEAAKLQASLAKDQEKKGTCHWGPKGGLHVVIFSLLCFPIAFLISFCFSFYIGTVAWYNIFVYLSEERTWAHKALLAPIVIILYPFLIIIAALLLGIVGACKQISWYFSSWLKAMRDPEKGFFGWLCHKLGVAQCSPYEVVILDDPVQTEAGNTDDPQQSSSLWYLPLQDASTSVSSITEDSLWQALGIQGHISSVH